MHRRSIQENKRKISRNAEKLMIPIPVGKTAVFTTMITTTSTTQNTLSVEFKDNAVSSHLLDFIGEFDVHDADYAAQNQAYARETELGAVGGADRLDELQKPSIASGPRPHWPARCLKR